MSNNHNHYATSFQFNEIDFCISKGRLSKKLVQKMIDNKNTKIENKDMLISEMAKYLEYKNLTDDYLKWSKGV